MYQAKHDRHAASRRAPRHTAAPPRRRHRWLVRALAAMLALGCLGYVSFVFLPIPFVRYWRNIYIETAMTTAHHKWLATAFIPGGIIQDVMAKQTGVVDTIGGLEVRPAGQADEDTPAASAAPGADSTPQATAAPTATPAPTPVPDILGQAQLTEGQPNEQGDLVLVNDREQGIVILEVKGTNYTAHLAMIDDPSRVFVATTADKGSRGTFICDYLAENDAVLGINANGFADEGGHGTGGEIAGQCYAQGQAWGEYKDNYESFGFDSQNRLLVGKIPDWDAYQIRDGAQFKPALIIDGEIVTAGSNGWGLQPRTCIGQREDGVVLFLVVDGRQIGYSIGATVGDCAEVLQRYGAVNACCCDGGSSSVMAYNGELVGIPSTPMKTTGRWLPNAFLVARRETDS